MLPRFLAAVLMLTGLTACPEGVDFFVNINGDIVQRVGAGEPGVIVGFGAENAESSTLVGGQLPPGLVLQPEGTASGIPAEIGFFEFTVETVTTDGQVTWQTSLVEVE